MKEHTYIYNAFLTLLLLSLLSSCEKDEMVVDPIDTNIPDSRSFYMGFTAFPYDLSSEALNQSYEYQAQNGDILLTHFDTGVPWHEALNDLPFPSEVQNDINGAIATSTANHKVMLSATATNTNRDGLADYWNNSGSHQPLTAPWNNYSFNNPNVITAYMKYCKRIIDAIQPDYFAYGIEMNSAFIEDTEVFNHYLIFADTVYNTLKHDYPDLPIFLTFQDQAFDKTKSELHHLTQILLEYSDMIAVSTYPFWQLEHLTGDANPTLFSNNWLREMRNLAPNKPFAISETGFCAEDLKIHELGVDIYGTATWQAQYV
ncbi:MAG: hypothetical protein GQ527_07955, partial [Bacteroidales bacterium]|nr:hypothetical protein [Bacteroidales bacterium]